VTETPETPTPSLAERDTGDLADDIEAWADVDASNLRSGSRVTSAEQLMGREPDLRAAAAQLRQLDRIKAAAGDDIEWSVALAVCRELAVRYPSWASDLNLTEALLRRISDALEADDGA
jgi:hypothetical protein